MMFPVEITVLILISLIAIAIGMMIGISLNRGR